MKIFITNNPERAPKTHLVLSPKIEENNDMECHIPLHDQNLDEYADDGELEELVSDGTVEYIPIHKVMEVLMGWVKKIKHGGTIIVSGVDAYLTAKAFVDGYISIEQFNVYVHGTPNEDNKTVNLTTIGIVNLMVSLGLTIKHKRLDINKFVVEGTRP